MFNDLGQVILVATCLWLLCLSISYHLKYDQRTPRKRFYLRAEMVTLFLTEIALILIIVN